MCFYHEEWELSDYSFKGSFMHAVTEIFSFFFLMGKQISLVINII